MSPRTSPHKTRIPARIATFGLALSLVVVATGRASDGKGKDEPEFQQGKIETIRGEVVETACFVMGNRRGESHRQCAISGVRAGDRLGVLDEKTRTLHLLVLAPEEMKAGNPLEPHIAERVQVRGRIYERAGTRGIRPSSVRKIPGSPRR